MEYTKKDYEKYCQIFDKYRDFSEEYRYLYHYLTRYLCNSTEKAIECIEMLRNKKTIIFNGDEIRYFAGFGIPLVQLNLGTTDKLLSHAKSRIDEYIKMNNFEFNMDDVRILSKMELLSSL